MAGWAIFKGWHSFALSLVVGYYAMLRTGEILGLRAKHLECAASCLQAVISLGYTKGGKRQGAAESVVLGLEPIVFLVKAWKKTVAEGTSLIPAKVAPIV